MMSLLAGFGLAVFLFAAYQIVPTLLDPFLTPLRHLRGPPTTSWFWGNVKDQSDGDAGEKTQQWVAEYGHVFRIKSLLNLDRLITTDTKAINHMLTHSAEYKRPALSRKFVAKMFGEGILFAEGRRIMNPAFGPAQIRDLTSLFLEKSIQLRDIWATSLHETDDNGTRIDILSGLSKMTLDVIGLAGFGYEFNALNPSGEVNPLGQALNEILSSGTPTSIAGLMSGLIPAFQHLPTKRARKTKAARETMLKIGTKLVAERKALILAASTNKDTKVSSKDLDGRDLLTLLMKANMASDIPESQKLSDEEVVSQIPTFFIAGHETTASAVTWCLYALSLDHKVQQKLREELLAVSTDMPSMDELMSLPYLDAVLRETLRLYPPVAGTLREAGKDDLIPLSKPFTDKYGEVHDTIRVRAGDQIVIPILAPNRSKELWGEDVDEFKPERWDHPPEAISNIPGVWGNILSFLGGPRSCIGYRFTLVEFKALVFTLIRAFEFNLAVSREDIAKKATIVMRPIVKSEADKGNQMPMLMKAYRR
ncbi:hypothetical protein NLI96_g8502 [Meripilus lineatus]|uniref:Cytochrome P450 n=1 Tax=Meripilus lineatus TaxID=2056292 RepID=A0AAD5YB29_9APHY|nr:hypothetical protein NLI96_g8502 [Physisporinus lineatus]